eukprot:CAMPEP_0119317304 /NCGR_PEP_ID=MMETSP1333-20130426/42700_1 /TAXON_ID=418940 /ORGANISM="Scyphosphaera apsteinii, Strain RCC1455" /LENGTH=280 /DNA_ID=CAMNT_0007323203 /DNA_START=224 /DNA_END=1066 /DNA_ORIENTATION=-
MLAAVVAVPAVANAEVTGEREVVTEVTVAKKGFKPVVVSRRRFTGAGDPEWTYPQRDISPLLLSDPFPTSWPYTGPDDFTRIDGAVDTDFYKFPKLVYHIDEGAVAALTHYYDRMIPDGSDVLDICSSWVSHYPRSFPARMNSLVGTGINELELACNDQLSSFVQADLNVKPALPFKDKSFDVITCVVSFDYLVQPLQVIREVARVLRPGGKVILSQSNRCFYTKAVGIWTRNMSDAAHLRVLATYIHFADSFDTPKVIDITPKGPGINDPMYIVQAQKA